MSSPEISLRDARSILVTGGAGAIGSRLVRRVRQLTDAPIVVVDDLSSGYEWLLPEDPKLQLIKADVCTLRELPLKIERPLVFHLAAFFANQNSVDHPEADLHTNGLGTLTVLRWAAEQKAARVVYASAGCSIAGHNINAPISEDMPVSLHLDTPYQITKALGEFYCNYFNSMVSTARCRFFNSYGPGEVPGRYRNVIPNFIWLALQNKPLVITGTGNETRDFIFVDDLVDGLLRAASIPEAHGESFNLGTGIETKVLDLARAIIELSGSRSEIVFGQRRAWDHSLRRQANITKARTTLGLAPQVEVLKGLSTTVAWYKQNFDKIQHVMKDSL